MNPTEKTRQYPAKTTFYELQSKAGGTGPVKAVPSPLPSPLPIPVLTPRVVGPSDGIAQVLRSAIAGVPVAARYTNGHPTPVRLPAQALTAAW